MRPAHVRRFGQYEHFEAIGASAVRGRDPAQTWAAYEHVLRVGRFDAQFAKVALAFCRKRMPSKAPAVLRAAISRRIIVTEPLLCSFLVACQSAQPTPVDEALEQYARSGLRTHDVIFAVVNVCRIGKRPDAALRLFADAVDNQVDMSERLFASFASCCSASRSASASDTVARLANLVLSKQVKTFEKRSTFDTLIGALLSHQQLGAALEALKRMDKAAVPTTRFLLNNVICALVKGDRFGDAMKIYRTMVDRNITIEVPILCVLLAHARLPNVRILHQYARDHAKVLDNHLFVSALIAAYDRCDHLAKSEQIFLQRRARTLPDVSTFTAMISAYVRNGRLDDACATLGEMTAAGLRPSVSTDLLVLSALADDDDMPRAMALFQQAAPGLGNAAPALTQVAHAAGRCCDASSVEVLHRFARDDDLLSNDNVSSSLISAYDRCSRPDACETLFRSLPRPGRILTWNAMILACSQHGLSTDAFQLFDELKASGLRPKAGTLSALLTCCARSGDLTTAQAFVDEFADTWRVPLSDADVAALIEIRGRLGDLDDAERIANTNANANVMSWVSMLRVCSWHEDVSRARRAFSHILGTYPTIEPRALASIFTFMSALFAAVGNVAEAERLANSMKERGLSRRPPRTWIQLPDRSAHVCADDPNCGAGHGDLIQRLLANGYSPDVSVVTKQTATDDDARQSVFLHGPKIALAAALAALPPGDPIRLTNSMWMCRDCHAFTRLASRIYNRDVYVRDMHSQHHFHRGRCSCADRW
ncbi:DYW domain-containing protein [Plasmodiophora brassicae]